MKRESAVQKTVEEIKSNILSDKFDVGDKFTSEMELCQNLGVSRTTVREAMRMLQVMGLVEVRPGLGAFILRKEPLSNQSGTIEWLSSKELEILDIIEARMGVEPIAAKLSAKRATEDDIFKIFGAHTFFERAFAANDPIAMAEADEKFHSQILTSSYNKALTVISNRLEQLSREYRVGLFAIENNGRLAIPMHRAVADAIADHDEDRAFRAMQDHISSVSINVKDITRG